METIEQGLRRILKNAPHIYAEVVRCAKERPFADWKREEDRPLAYSHFWGNNTTDNNHEYWSKLDDKIRAGEEIGPDYPLPPDSPIRQKEVGNWYMCVDVISNPFFDKGKWYKCINPTNEAGAFKNNFGNKGGRLDSNDIVFDLSNPLPHNPETKPKLKYMETKPEPKTEPTQKTEINLMYEHFEFRRADNKVEIVIYVQENQYVIDRVSSVNSDEETFLELQLEAVRFAKKRLSDISGNYSNN